MDRRDEIINRLHAKKKFIISSEEPHASIRVDGYNHGLQDAINLLQEYL